MQSQSSSSRQGSVPKKQTLKKKNPVMKSVRNAAKFSADFHLSKCASEYAACIGNPIDGPLACIPSFPSLNTRKIRTFVRTNFSTNTVGFGFSVIEPTGMIARDVNSVFFSSAGGAVTSPQITDLVAVSNSEYTSADIGNTPATAQYRVVSACLRIRYVGSELERGGQITGYADPDHSSLIGRGFTVINSEEEAKQFKVSREWKTVYYKPVADAELAFSTNAVNPFTAAFSNYMGFVVQSTAPATPLIYQAEAYATFEVQGRNIRGRTPSLADPNGFAAVQSVMALTKMGPDEMTPEQSAQRMVVATNQYANNHLTSSAPKPAPTKETHGFDFLGAGMRLLEWGLPLLLTAI